MSVVKPRTKSGRVPAEVFSSPSTPPHLNLTLTDVSSASGRGGGGALWVCGQRNAAHISATAAVEVMRSRVGACRAVCTSLFCINNRMSYRCTKQAVFSWARVCLRAGRWSTPTPLPLIYTLTSRDVCSAEAFPNPCTSPPGPLPTDVPPMPGTGSRRQKRVRGIHLSVVDLVKKRTPARGVFHLTPESSQKKEMPVNNVCINASPGTTDLCARGIAVEIERTLKISQWKRGTAGDDNDGFLSV